MGAGFNNYERSEMTQEIRALALDWSLSAAGEIRSHMDGIIVNPVTAVANRYLPDATLLFLYDDTLAACEYLGIDEPRATYLTTAVVRPMRGLAKGPRRARALLLRACNLTEPRRKPRHETASLFPAQPRLPFDDGRLPKGSVSRH